ncbi:MAG: hypothetical protein L0Z50_05000 [Verrucomicrobiales bacterium]|nr:hypothetical protein [Verrucomicrobiales bacterium]
MNQPISTTKRNRALIELLASSLALANPASAAPLSIGGLHFGRWQRLRRKGPYCEVGNGSIEGSPMNKQVFLAAVMFASRAFISHGAASTLQFELPNFEANEADRMAYVTVTCTPPPTVPVTARLVRIGGAATRTDFQDAYWWDNGLDVGFYPVNFQGNPNFKAEIGLFLTDDGVPEPDETVSFTIVDILGPAVAGTVTNAVLTIHNGGLRIASPGLHGATEGERIHLPLYRLGDTNVPMSVDFSTVDGTARAGIDYIGATGTVTFASGQLFSGIQITSIDNGRVDGSRDFQIRLTNPSLGVSLFSTSVVARISDNESPVVWDRTFSSKETASVQSFTVASDGKLIVSRFGNEEGISQTARLNADGSIDPTFRSVSLSPRGAQQLLLDSEGRCLLVGIFSAVNGQPYPGLVRLRKDGSLDETFRPPANLTTVYTASPQIALQPDGRILFLDRNEQKRVRLNTDGSLDNTFRPPQATADAQHVVVTVSSQIITCVGYSSAGTAEPLVRLSSNGILDAEFHRAEFTAYTNDIPAFNVLTLQPDGKLFVAGRFQFVDGYPRAGLVRLNADGTVDTGFAPTPEADFDGFSANIYSIVLDSQNRVLVAGEFNHFNGKSLSLGLVRLNPDGTLHSIFAPGGSDAFQQLSWSTPDAPVGAIGSIHRMVLRPDDYLLVEGVTSSGYASTRRFFARMYTKPPSNSFEFAASEFIAKEGESSAVVTVRRLGDTTGFATVDYATSEGSAVAGKDYLPTNGTLAFAPLEQVKTFQIPLLSTVPVSRGLDLDLSLTLANSAGVELISGPRSRLSVVTPFGFHSIAAEARTRKFTILGSPGSTYALEEITFQKPPWWFSGPTIITTVTLTNRVQSITDDSTIDWGEQPKQRLYRLRRLAQ